MPFVDAKPVMTKFTGPTIKASVKLMASGGSKVVFMMNAAALEDYFQGAKPKDFFRVQYGQGDQAGRALITKVKEGDIELRLYGNAGASYLAVSGWHGVMGREFRSKPCKVLTANNAGVVVELPWFDKSKEQPK